MNSLNVGIMDNQPLRLTDREFKMFRDLIFEKSGINLRKGKKELVRTRLGSRIKAKNLKSFEDYFRYIKEDKSNDELLNALDAISTNLTSFFREIKHFQFIEEKIIPELMAEKKPAGNQALRAWSAGCSSGEEPYTILFTLLENVELSNSWEIKLLATDISLEMLEKAISGVYSEDKMTDVPKHMIGRYFRKGSNENAGLYRVKPEIRRLAHFRRFNLMTYQFPFKYKFDFIFCRNVMIYFDKSTQQSLILKLYDALANGGYLLIGHAESLTGIEHQFKYIYPTIYKKPESRRGKD